MVYVAAAQTRNACQTIWEAAGARPGTRGFRLGLGKQGTVKKSRKMVQKSRDPASLTEALRERHERLRRRRGKAPVEELRAIAKRAAAHLKSPYLDHAEFLYDERGLPK